MTKRVKKQASSMSFSLSRWFRKISSSKPSAATFIIIVIGFTTFLLGGGLLTVTTRPPIAIYSGHFYFLYPSMDSQFGMDTIFSAILYAVGLTGLLLVYRSTKNAYKPRQAYMTFIIGVALIVLAYLFLESSILYKLNGGQ